MNIEAVVENHVSLILSEIERLNQEINERDVVIADLTGKIGTGKIAEELEKVKKELDKSYDLHASMRMTIMALVSDRKKLKAKLQIATQKDHPQPRDHE